MSFCDKVAIIDSGIGGVAVLNKLIEKFKAGEYVYIADNLYMPYGNKNNSDVLKRISYLIDLAQGKYHCNKVILACNTASIITADIDTFKGILKLDFNKRGTYLTTQLTADNLVRKRRIGLKDLAYQIEMNILDKQKIQNIVKDYIHKYNLIKHKKLILACTHYELIHNEFAVALPNTKIIDNSNDLIDKIHLETDGNLKILVVLTKRNNKYKRLIKSLITN